MAGPNVEDYLKEGIYGQKEIKPDERRKFLGTLRERVVIALTQAQVRETGTYSQVEEQMKEYPNAQVFLNGNMNYQYLSKYTKICSKYDIEYTMVTNKEYNSELGLVLAVDEAIDKEDIYVEKKIIQPQKEEKKGIFSKFTGLFKK